VLERGGAAFSHCTRRSERPPSTPPPSKPATPQSTHPHSTSAANLSAMFEAVCSWTPETAAGDEPRQLLNATWEAAITTARPSYCTRSAAFFTAAAAGEHAFLVSADDYAQLVRMCAYECVCTCVCVLSAGLSSGWLIRW